MIKIRGVSKSFIKDGEAAAFYALKDINLDIERGFTLIIGQSGSGKSTLLHILGLLETPDCLPNDIDYLNYGEKKKAKIASIEIDGKDIIGDQGTFVNTALRKKIGTIFQFPALNDTLTVLDNATLPLLVQNVKKKIRNKKGKLILDELGLLDKKKKLTSQLSGGERQRVDIARAMSADPDIVLADEPTGNLDTKNGMNVLSLLVSLCRKRNIYLIMVSHNMGYAQYANHLIELKDGKVVRDELQRGREV